MNLLKIVASIFLVVSLSPLANAKDSVELNMQLEVDGSSVTQPKVTVSLGEKATNVQPPNSS